MGTVLNREEKQTIHIHNNKMFVKAALFTLLVCSSQAGWQQHLARQASKPAGNLVEELAANGASTLIDFAVKAGLADTLTGEGPFTVFAPTNAAFAALCLPRESTGATSPLLGERMSAPRCSRLALSRSLLTPVTPSQAPWWWRLTSPPLMVSSMPSIL